MSSISYHEKEHADAKSSGKSLRRKIQQRASPDFPLVSCIQYTGKNDLDTLSKLHDITDHIALQGPPVTAFKNHVKLEKFHGVKFICSYENESTCKNLIFRISEYLLEEGVKKKLDLVHFIAM